MKTLFVLALVVLQLLAAGCAADVRYRDGGRELQILLKRIPLRADSRGEDAAIPPVVKEIADATH